MAKRDNSLIAALDVGTTKICVLVGEPCEDGTEVVGIGQYPSRGLRKGVVVDVESTIQSIKKAVEEAELMVGCTIPSVYVGIAGGHIKGFNSTGIVKIRDGEVKDSDLKRVIETATAVDIPPDREVLHVIPQEYMIDGQDGIKEPLGLVGVRLEAQVHIVTGAVTSAQNIVKCANNAGLNVHDIVLEQLASSEAVLTQDEKDLGVALIDIGGRNERPGDLLQRERQAHGGYLPGRQPGDHGSGFRSADPDFRGRRGEEEVGVLPLFHGRFGGDDRNTGRGGKGASGIFPGTLWQRSSNQESVRSSRS